VSEERKPTVITRQHGGYVITISLEDYDSMQETLHLLSTPSNADRLRESMAEFKAGRTFVKEWPVRGAGSDSETAASMCARSNDGLCRPTAVTVDRKPA